ncbi:MAG TPA: pyruvate dehydrogenase (acetyl-transferring), homodimeric type [Planctomycetota bacterium]|jgi:pyruvate dehydrogenase E1 component|nr:pyruvate dehydrogenase (acetyl-transferring), homodimeric type [Planctomycetota bacterium]
MDDSPTVDHDPAESRDWLESLDDLHHLHGPEAVRRVLRDVQIHAQRSGVVLPVTSETPYVNTIPRERQPPYPGDRALEQRIKSLVRWNAMAMVVRANRIEPGIGGHISTYASAATLYEVGFNHFFRGRDHECGGDFVYFQGHASPGIYARAFLEGRLTEGQLERFRRELAEGGGLPSYPHPWLMPEFWEFPTVSMGLGSLMAIYRARFMRYLEDRGLRPARGAKVWAFVGDGECDEPEALGAITLAPRERLDNLIFVVNCNLQRLDGPVRGNGKIIQELEAAFRGAGWNVIKVIWGNDWDPLFEKDADGLLVRRLGEIVDGESQRCTVEGGAVLRQVVFGGDPRLEAMVSHLTDDQLWKLRLGGHDPEKVHAAYKAAVEHAGEPTVILAQTIKGYGLGEAGEGKNVTHQQKKMNEQELLRFRDRFGIPISTRAVGSAPFYRPSPDSAEIRYLLERRSALGGFVPRRTVVPTGLRAPSEHLFEEFAKGSGDGEASTTMALVRLLAKILKDERVGPRIVPIVPDEARTFGMEALFRQFGIYSSVGQLYPPVDRKSLLYYREAKDGQILEEGITEAGSMASFLAAGTAHAGHGIATVPIFFFYSMFGLQRIGDLVWAAGDSRCRGILVGATAGRTTLAGEGLQHQDGNSHLLAFPVPNLLAYDPAYAYEIAAIVQDALRRILEKEEDVLFYLTVGNETYRQPPMPPGAKEGILRGIYRLRAAESAGVHLLGSGAILNEAVRAQALLESKFGVASDVWSVTSYKALHRDALETERWNRLHPAEAPRVPYLRQALGGAKGVFVAATDYVKALPETIARWIPGRLVSLGTDGFGRSDGRARLRRFFEVDAASIALAALHALAQEGALPSAEVVRAIRELEVDADRPDPARA